MKAEELRINSWYKSVKFGVPVKWELTDFSQLDVMSDGAYNDPPIDEYIEPIPLTEEWLLKLRFEVFDSVRFLGDGYNVWKQLPNSRFSLYTIDGLQWICRILAHELNEVQYVHQLQNLYFALTGNELTIR